MATDFDELQSKLWEAADQLRATSALRASEYSTPVLGLIFLRYADQRFSTAEETVGSGTARRPVRAEDYQAAGALYLPEESRFGPLLELAEGADLGAALKKAMAGIEAHNSDLRGVLPKDYSRIPNDILRELLRLLWGVPGTIEGDRLGLIYEYFLGKFALSEGRQGGCVQWRPASTARTTLSSTFKRSATRRFDSTRISALARAASRTSSFVCP